MRLRSLFVLISVLPVEAAVAQMVLPGAAPTTPVGKTGAPLRAGGGGGQPKTIPVRIFGADSVAAKSLWLNGGADRIVFAPGGALAPAEDKTKSERSKQPVVQGSLAVVELKMTGDSIAHPGRDCRIDVKPVSPVPAKPLGTPAGLLRYQLDLPACPFSFDVLDGAILTTAGTTACSFVQADCKVNPAGLWGASAGELTPDRDKAIERERRGADATEFQNFKALVARTRDRALVKTIAAEQAAFSSRREETCRSYAQESVHGYCAARVTQARAAELQNLVNLSAATAPPAKKRRVKNATE